MQFSAFSYRFKAFYRDICASLHYLICSDAVAENSNDRKLQGRIWQLIFAGPPKMVAGAFNAP